MNGYALLDTHRRLGSSWSRPSFPPDLLSRSPRMQSPIHSLAKEILGFFMLHYA